MLLLLGAQCQRSTMMRERDGDSHHRDLYYLAVARPVAGGTAISAA